ncbi:histidinol dehydrogenase [Ktedonosporobacter rubrisoli]|uniref:histidinol dehydrogenase n=1 Tax=Ktedonosporobacter rubrisoli TaxID=2509675 RepID=A0A4P6JZM1_KTERU|nr:histidinol dehydrogenase [Ktedonosporobacter rubrisoli]QBD81358.1 histidinol dehydrogenase [Ktedonosporobacter rubrisoli]
MIHFYELAKLDTTRRARLLRRAEVAIDDLIDYVRPIVHAVRDRGDEALIEFMARFDRVKLTPARLRVDQATIEQAYDKLDKDVYAAIKHAIKNVRTFHERQMPHEQWFTQVAPGVMAGEKITPISSVGLYVPRGKGAFPSVMYMLATPASIAGVPRIVVCTPPGPDGEIDPASLVAADLCGVHEIYRASGAQAIAALAYGTESIARVHKLTGPGSPYVSAAKRLLYGTVDVGLPAGPSESILLADESADPELVARDLLIEAEHGPDSSSLLVTDSQALVEAVLPVLTARLEALPQWRQDFCRAGFEGEKGTGGIVLAPDMAEAIKFVNEYAPEHLEVQVREPFAILPELKNAGEILLGPFTPTCIGNYSLGTNAILPTGGFGHTFSCTSVYDFLKRTGIGYLTQEGLASLSETTRQLAEFEGFPAHARAVIDRPAPSSQS